MWIRNQIGNYVNMDNVLDIQIVKLKSGDWALRAEGQNNAEYCTLSIFHYKEDAQNYLDRMMAAITNNIFKVSMEDWNYTGHKKDRKETRHGGS